jgi:hypothetical protein
MRGWFETPTGAFASLHGCYQPLSMSPPASERPSWRSIPARVAETYPICACATDDYPRGAATLIGCITIIA